MPLRGGDERRVDLYLVFAERESARPGTLRLAEIIREHVANRCVAQPGSNGERT